jgi:hypothetical protein
MTAQLTSFPGFVQKRFCSSDTCSYHRYRFPLSSSPKRNKPPPQILKRRRIEYPQLRILDKCCDAETKIVVNVCYTRVGHDVRTYFSDLQNFCAFVHFFHKFWNSVKYIKIRTDIIPHSLLLLLFYDLWMSRSSFAAACSSISFPREGCFLTLVLRFEDSMSDKISSPTPRPVRGDGKGACVIW